MPYIPPWLKAADPAAQWARGYPMGLQTAEIGLRQQNVGQELAIRREEGARRAQEFAMSQETERARLKASSDAQRQKAELEERYFTQAAKAAADKAAAILEYQQAIQEGMDPTKAILKYGPAMGQSGAEAAALRGQYQQALVRMQQEQRQKAMDAKIEMQNRAIEAGFEKQSRDLEAKVDRQQTWLANQRALQESRESVQRGKLAFQAATQTVKSILDAGGAAFMLPEAQQQERAKKDPGFAAQKARLEEARAVMRRYMSESGQGATGETEIDAALEAAPPPQSKAVLRYNPATGTFVPTGSNTKTADTPAPPPGNFPSSPAWPADESQAATIPPSVQTPAPAQHGALYNWFMRTNDKPTAEEAAPGQLMQGIGSAISKLAPATPAGGDDYTRSLAAAAAQRHAQNLASPGPSLQDIINLLSPETPEGGDAWTKEAAAAAERRKKEKEEEEAAATATSEEAAPEE